MSCHERTRRRLISGTAVAGGHRPRPRRPLRLLARDERGRGQQRTEGRRGGVVLPDAVPRRADRRGARRASPVADRARPGAARPGDQRQQTAAAQRGGRWSLYLKGLQPAVDEAVEQSERRRRTSTPPPSPASRTTATRCTATRHEHDEATRSTRDEDEHERRPRPARLARPGEVRRGRRGRRQGPREGRPGPRGRLQEEHRGAGQEAGRPRHRVRGRPEEHQDEGLLHHPRRLRLPRRALRPAPRRPSPASTPRPSPAPARIKELQQDRQGGRRHHRLLRDAGQRQDREDPRRRRRPQDRTSSTRSRASPTKSRGDDYFAVMESNLKALQTALGAK